MSPTDDLNLPGRTMLTSEGTVNRSTHFLHVVDDIGLLLCRRAERLQDFPDNWTALKDYLTVLLPRPDKSRYSLWECISNRHCKRIADLL